ncbi:hypothetical protein [uncultured Winogradskyella sp.]|uniref:hypothetical protein n=1 Tax=uncultured Winogradskyella sp. TaxID=395353 RepID=UPI0026134571|nr:hypothetical protein [uncultured Winogradskyella sp.]
MSKKLDDLDLEVIRELAKQSKTVQDLIQEKNNTLINVEQSQNIKFKTLDPTPKPKGDIRINKMQTKQTMSNEALEQKLDTIKEEYNGKIKEALEEKAIEVDQENIYPMVESLDKHDTSVLIENGREAFKERLQEKEQKLKEELAIDMDSLDQRNMDYPIYSDFEKNLEDLNKIPSPADDFE